MNVAKGWFGQSIGLESSVKINLQSEIIVVIFNKRTALSLVLAPLFVAGLIALNHQSRGVDHDQSHVSRVSEPEGERLSSMPDFSVLEGLEVESSSEHNTNRLADQNLNSVLAGFSTAEEMKLAIEFLETRGYVSPEALEMYQNYSEVALQAMGDEGDLVALAVLVGMYAETDYDKFGNATLRSIVHGSVSFAQMKADMHFSQSEIQRAESGHGSPDVARQEFLLSLSWYEFIKLRGGGDAVDTLIEKRIDESTFTLSENDKAAIRSQGANIYDYLSEERRRLGLGEYDNHVPPGLEHFLELIGIY